GGVGSVAGGPWAGPGSGIRGRHGRDAARLPTDMGARLRLVAVAAGAGVVAAPPGAVAVGVLGSGCGLVAADQTLADVGAREGTGEGDRPRPARTAFPDQQPDGGLGASLRARDPVRTR